MKFFNASMEAARFTPEELSAEVKSAVARLGRLGRQAGIRSE